MFTLILSALSLVLVLAGIGALRRALPEWWSSRWLRRFTWSLALLVVFGQSAIWLGTRQGSFELYQAGKLAWAASVVTVLPLFSALLLSLLGLRFQKRRANKRGLTPESAAAGRRRFLKVAAAAPCLSLAGSFGGLMTARLSPDLHELEVAIPGLDPRLDGFRILQVTDAHLGPFVGIDSIDDTLEALDGVHLDLVAVTGDFADHLRLAKPAMERLASLNAAHGMAFTMGNHEYYHPPGKVRALMEKLGVRTLVDEGALLNVDGAALYLAGADDPARTDAPEDEFLHRSVQKALRDQPSAACTVLLSHRPRGFAATRDLDVHLTLAGHTHGYQLGLFGTSLAEPLLPGTFPRGLYRSGNRQLYTSTGFGHWFPFRLGCNREAAVIVLRRDASKDA